MLQTTSTISRVTLNFRATVWGLGDHVEPLLSGLRSGELDTSDLVCGGVYLSGTAPIQCRVFRFGAERRKNTGCVDNNLAERCKREKRHRPTLGDPQYIRNIQKHGSTHDNKYCVPLQQQSRTRVAWTCTSSPVQVEIHTCCTQKARHRDARFVSPRRR